MTGANAALAFLLIALPGMHPAAAAPGGRAYLVKDINTMPDPETDSQAAAYFTLNGTAYFAADDGVHGRELWRSDGTAAGTFMVADLLPGSGGSRPGLFVAIGDTLYFTAGLGTGDCALWRSDGTAATTIPIHVFFRDGALGCFGSFRGYVGPTRLTVIGDTVFFELFTQDIGQEIWASDGTAGGTRLVKDVNPDSAGAPSTILGQAGARLLFTADDGRHGVELWSSDGTAPGTSLLSDIKPGAEGSIGEFDEPAGFTVGDVVLFVADDGENGRELWRSDGTAQGTRVVKDLTAGETGSRFSFVDVDADYAPAATTLGNALIFAHVTETGHTLWRSDGTSDGTLPLREFLFAQSGFTLPARLTAATGQVFFSVGEDELWVTDGSVVGTQRVPSVPPNDDHVYPLAAIGPTLYFLVSEDSACALWRSDAPAGESRLVRRFSTESWCEEELEAGVVDDHLLFSADEDVHGIELFISDGTESGTRLLQDINAGSERTDDGFDPFEGAPWRGTFNGALLFEAQDGSAAATLWRSDGTSDGTLAIRAFDAVLNGVDASAAFVFWARERQNFALWATDLTPGATSAIGGPTVPGALLAIGDHVFATSSTAGNEGQLWRADASTRTAMSLRSFAGRPSPPLRPPGPFHLTEGPNSRLFFVVWTPDAGEELWTSDGTEAGTEMLRDINPDEDASGPTGLVRWNDRVYFFANDGVRGTELWQSDGTAGGTVAVTDILGPAASAAASPVAVGDQLYFFAHEGGTSALYTTDGTPEGSRRIAQVPGLLVDAATDLRTGVVGDMFFFPAGTAATGLELWRSDGTENGTAVVRDIRPGPGSSLSDLFEWTALNHRLFFSADDGVHGTELWQSDGTAAGTTIVRDIDPRLPEDIENVRLRPARVGDVVVFTHFTPALGRELWRTDGTVGGTRLVDDIAAGQLSSGAGEKGYRAVGSTLLFTANDRQHGEELWGITIEGLNASCGGDCDDDGTVGVNELVRGVNIALDRQALDACPPFDTDRNGRVTVDELVAAVRRALNGC